jgi:peptidoglycan/LPS O-acetylase OafA/YrhL
MVFFVLSGFLVGGSVLSRTTAEQWSWSDYALRRMTRLWIVLLPALLLTAFWDRLGITITRSPFYSGAMANIYNSGPSLGTSQFGLGTFLGNLAFVQTIAVPTFGSNGPLWSLANEFWYYVLFPLLLWSVVPVKTNLSTRAFCATLGIVACYLLPGALLVYGLIWLLGVAAFIMHRRFPLRRLHRTVWLAVSAILLGTSLLLGRASSSALTDLAIGATFALMLVPLSQISLERQRLAHAFRSSANMSYTLYLVHFPFIAFLASYMLSNSRYDPSYASVGIFTGCLILVLLYAYGIYFVFERNTDVVRKRLSTLLRIPGKGTAKAATRVPRGNYDRPH